MIVIKASLHCYLNLLEFHISINTICDDYCVLDKKILKLYLTIIHWLKHILAPLIVFIFLQFDQSWFPGINFKLQQCCSRVTVQDEILLD